MEAAHSAQAFAGCNTRHSVGEICWRALRGTGGIMRKAEIKILAKRIKEARSRLLNPTNNKPLCEKSERAFLILGELSKQLDIDFELVGSKSLAAS